MARSTSNGISNILLSSLPAADKENIRPLLELLDLEIRHEVFNADQPIRYVYFPRDCVISIHIRMREGVAVETATVGREGLVGLPVFLGGESQPSTAFCRVSGRAARMTTEDFRAAVASSPAFYEILLRYTQALLSQVSQTAACNRVHSVEQRCARWLLTTHDRVQRDAFELTQETLGEMLAVRRPRVSIAAAGLQRRGFIRYSRGRVNIVDRAGLEAAACECYKTIEREYLRLFG